MSKYKNIVLIIIGICLMVGTLGEILLYFDIKQFGVVTHTATSIWRIGALILILLQGTMIKRKHFLKLNLAFLIIIFIESLMKIMHWPSATLILDIGLVSIPLIYSIHFFQKNKKSRLDVLLPYFAS